MSSSRLLRGVGAATIVAAAFASFALFPRASRPARAQALCDGTLTDPTQTIEVTTGQPIVIQIAANATTGYEWLLSQPPDPGVAQTVSSQYIAPQPTDPPTVGQGGEQCWVFLGVGAGDTSVSFDYRRPFELDAPPAQSVAFAIAVDPAQ